MPIAVPRAVAWSRGKWREIGADDVFVLYKLFETRQKDERERWDSRHKVYVVASRELFVEARPGE